MTSSSVILPPLPEPLTSLMLMPFSLARVMAPKEALGKRSSADSSLPEGLLSSGADSGSGAGVGADLDSSLASSLGAGLAASPPASAAVKPSKAATSVPSSTRMAMGCAERQCDQLGVQTFGDTGSESGGDEGDGGQQTWSTVGVGPTLPTATSFSPASLRILAMTPSSWNSKSIWALSVSISTRTSPGAMLSPGFFCQAPIFPAVMVGDRAGILMTWCGGYEA